MIGPIGVVLAICVGVAGISELQRGVRTPTVRSRAWFGWTCLILALATMLGGLWSRGQASIPVAILYAIALVAIAYSLIRQRKITRSPTRRPLGEAAHTSRLAVVGELTASIAHEINQPLGAILSNAEAAEMLLEGSDPPLDEVRQILRDIRRDGLRASGVIHNVRNLARKRELTFTRIDANEVARAVVDLLEPDMRRRGVPVEASLLPQVAYLHGDRLYLEQVLLNLILNAMDAVEALNVSALTAHPAVRLVVLRTKNGETQFRVIDKGQGIPVDRLPHLFDSFYTSKPHGVGLGLSISRSIVEAHGGAIRAENNRDGGATFQVTLPPYNCSSAEFEFRTRVGVDCPKSRLPGEGGCHK